MSPQDMGLYSHNLQSFYIIDVSLKRIRALRDFGSVKKGDVGGFIEHESDLSHLAYGVCCLLFLMECEAKQIGHDDRPHKN
ncbi:MULTISPECIES: hypothetical protein [Bartonella]|uniref:hypothetical protein n=1 Tax=Bartonella TaxID=773 RepID=UPI002E7C4A30|nr:hypothetical protein [Bartonella grahamii]